MSGVGRVILAAALLSGAGIAPACAQTVLGDPRDAAKIFAANCSACHKGPQGLAKSGQVAGFLRQHYTTGPEMSAAMAAYLVAAGNAPASKKGPAASADAATAPKTKGKKGEQLAAQHPQGESPETIQQRTLRGKQRQPLAHEAPAAPQAVPTHQPPAEESKQTAALNAPQTAAPAPVPSAEPPPAVLNIPMPELPEGPPSDLVQSFFSSSPLP